MPPDIAAFRTAELGHWLARNAREMGRLDLLFQSYCHELASRGLPLWRASLGLEILHPETSGKMLTWTDGALASRLSERAGVVSRPDYLKSPVRIVDETNRPFRRRLDGPSPDLPLLEELREQGASDYVIFPLPFLDASRT